MTAADVYWQHRRLWVRLHEKGGKEHSMPSYHNLETYLHDYIEAADITDDREGRLFRTAYRRTGILTDRPMTQSDGWRMQKQGYRGRNTFLAPNCYWRMQRRQGFLEIVEVSKTQDWACPNSRAGMFAQTVSGCSDSRL